MIVAQDLTIAYMAVYGRVAVSLHGPYIKSHLSNQQPEIHPGPISLFRQYPLGGGPGSRIQMRESDTYLR